MRFSANFRAENIAKWLLLSLFTTMWKEQVETYAVEEISKDIKLDLESYFKLWGLDRKPLKAELDGRVFVQEGR